MNSYTITFTDDARTALTVSANTFSVDGPMLIFTTNAGPNVNNAVAAFLIEDIKQVTLTPSA